VEHQHLADLEISKVPPGAKADMIIGQDNADLLVPLEVRHGPGGENAPFAIRTRLGWVLNGSFGKGVVEPGQVFSMSSVHACYSSILQVPGAMEHADERIIGLTVSSEEAGGNSALSSEDIGSAETNIEPMKTRPADALEKSTASAEPQGIEGNVAADVYLPTDVDCRPIVGLYGVPGASLWRPYVVWVGAVAVALLIAALFLMIFMPVGLPSGHIQETFCKPGVIDKEVSAPADLWEAPANLMEAPADLLEAPADLMEAPADLWEAPANLWGGAS